jgi:hypothetical protein
MHESQSASNEMETSSASHENQVLTSEAHAQSVLECKTSFTLKLYIIQFVWANLVCVTGTAGIST